MTPPAPTVHLRRWGAARALCGYPGETCVEWYPGASAPSVSCAACNTNAHPEDWRPPVKLVGRDGNAFAILAACRQAARDAGWSADRWANVLDELTAGNYDDLLRGAMKYFDVT